MDHLWPRIEQNAAHIDEMAAKFSEYSESNNKMWKKNWETHGLAADTSLLQLGRIKKLESIVGLIALAGMIQAAIIIFILVN